MAVREGQAVRNIWREHVLSYVNGEGERHEGGMDASSAFLLHLANMNRKPTLDVDIVSHCNLNCVSCCHFSPLAEPHFLSLDEWILRGFAESPQEMSDVALALHR